MYRQADRYLLYLCFCVATIKLIGILLCPCNKSCMRHLYAAKCVHYKIFIILFMENEIINILPRIHVVVHVRVMANVVSFYFKLVCICAICLVWSTLREQWSHLVQIKLWKNYTIFSSLQLLLYNVWLYPTQTGTIWETNS